MNFWTGVHFFSFCVYTFAVFYVIIKNPFAVINWVLAMLFFYFGLWSACSFLLDNTTTTLAAAEIIIKVQSVGWASIMSYYLFFILYLTNNKKLLSNKLLLAAILMIPGIFIFQNFRGKMLICCSQAGYGQAASWANSIWAYSYFAFYTLVFLWGAYLLYRHRKTAAAKIEKQVAGILFNSATAVFIIGTFFSVVMNYMKIYNPVDVNVVFLIFVGGCIYCAEKYETFTLSSTRNTDRIMELINEGVMLLDREGILTTSNRAAMEIFGFSEGRNYTGAAEFIKNTMQDAGFASAGKEVENKEASFTDAAGKNKTVLVSSRELYNGRDGYGKVCTIRDITGMKKAEVDLLDTVRELKRSNEELENFAYVASHDMKEPLRMVTSYVQLIKKRFADKLGQDGIDYITFASDGSTRMSGLIDGLLAYSRVKKAHKDTGTVDTGAVVAKVLDMMKYQISDKKAVIKTEGRLPEIRGVATLVEQLFQNIIGNALKFTSAGPAVIILSAVKKGNFYEFTCMDNGIGIEMQYKDRVFQIFQRLNAREDYEGTGIGLAICRKIVETHGGEIRVESDGLGKGSSFIFTLPGV